MSMDGSGSGGGVSDRAMKRRDAREGQIPTTPTTRGRGMGRGKEAVEVVNDADRDKVVFVGGIPYNVMEDKLLHVFAQMVGSSEEVEYIKLIRERRSPDVHKGYGFVKFIAKEKAAAVRAIGKVMFDGALLDIGEPVRKTDGNKGQKTTTADSSNKEKVEGKEELDSLGSRSIDASIRT